MIYLLAISLVYFLLYFILICLAYGLLTVLPVLPGGGKSVIMKLQAN